MLFPVSGIDVNPVVPFAAAFFVSFFTSMGGVSGAFLLLPFQFSVLNYTAPSVSATNQVFNIVATPGGVYRYIREGRMIWPLTSAVIIGTLPGVFIGAWVRIEYLPDPKNFKFFAGVVLLYIGWRLVKDILQTSKVSVKRATKTGYYPVQSRVVAITASSMRRVEFEYDGATYQFAPPAIYLLCFVVGIVGGIYGIGGGAVIAPFFVAFVGLPVYTIAGAALMGTFVTSVAGGLFYQFLSNFYPGMSISPDWLLGGLFGLGGFFGMYCGARMQKFAPARIIKAILCVSIISVAGQYLVGFFL